MQERSRWNQGAEAKGNAQWLRMHRTQCRERLYQRLERVRQAARHKKKERFTALIHHINGELLFTAYYWLKRNAAVGVDGLKWADYEDDMNPNLADLNKRLHANTYQAQPSRRQYIPKPDARQCPLGIAALEDKIHAYLWTFSARRIPAHTDITP